MGQLSLESLEDRLLLDASPASTGQLLQAYGQLPLSFEANQGQTAAPVNYLTRGDGYTLFLTPSQAVLELQKPAPRAAGGSSTPQSAATQTLSMRLVGASPTSTVVGLDRQAGVSNYLLGNDPSRWVTNVPNFGRVECQNLYAGINLIYYGNGQTRLEYDFDVAPGANAGAIRLAFQGARAMAVDGQGNLVLHLAGGDMIEQAPVAYQTIDGVRQSVSCRYLVGANGQVRFALGAYNTSRALVIDPVLSYSTYLGGSGAESGPAVAVDPAGNVYLTGCTSSVNFPTQNPLQASLGGGTDVFVTGLNASGTARVFSTYLGGSSNEGTLALSGFGGIAVDGGGNIYVAGVTGSTDFPIRNPYQASLVGTQDFFVSKLSPGGSSLVYSTYLGGSGTQTFLDSGYYGSAEGQVLAVDRQGDAYLAGVTNSANYPVQNPLQAANAGGYDVIVSELNSAGTALVFSTYLGGSGDETNAALALDSAGNVYLAGSTTSGNFPTANPVQAALGGQSDAFVTKLTAGGAALAYSTYLGGSLNDFAFGIAVDSSGAAYVAGQTDSTNFPTASPFQAANPSGSAAAFLAKLNAGGTALVYSTYFGTSTATSADAVAVLVPK
jgi:hypothetical protein